MTYGGNAAAETSFAVVYSSGITSPNSFKISSQSPKSTGSLVLTSWSASLTLTAYLNLGLSYADYISLDAQADISGTVSYVVGPSSSASVLVSGVGSRRMLQDHTETASPAFSFVGGDILNVDFDYQGFPKSEMTHLFYSIEKAGVRRQIQQMVFNTSMTGDGVYTTSIMIPWDALLTGDGTDQDVVINVQASNKIDDVHTSQAFSVALYTETDGIFSAPQLGEIVALDTPYEVQWNHLLLRFFASVHPVSLMGGMRIASNVTLEIISERLFTNGSVMTTLSTPLTTEPVRNTGKYIVTFSSNLTTTGDRFYVQARAAKKSDVIYGWSKGYFTFVGMPVHRATTARRDSDVVTSRHATPHASLVSAHPKHVSTQASKACLTYSLSTGMGDLKASCYLLGETTLLSGVASIAIIPNKQSCVLLAEPTAAPSTRAPITHLPTTLVPTAAPTKTALPTTSSPTTRTPTVPAAAAPTFTRAPTTHTPSTHPTTAPTISPTIEAYYYYYSESYANSSIYYAPPPLPPAWNNSLVGCSGGMYSGR